MPDTKAADGNSLATSYYAGLNLDLLDRIPVNSRAVLEIGCGTGQLARAFRLRAPEVRYWGIESHAPADDTAAAFLDRLILGDVEDPATLKALDDARGETLFDCVVFGDVLEHLHDPWQTLQALRERMSPGGTCCVCIPNVAHWSLLLEQLRGRWTYASSGLLDRTHLRFFTRDSALAMMRSAGWTPTETHPRVIWPEKTKAAVTALSRFAREMNIPPGVIQMNTAAYQWVIRASNGEAPPPLRVVAIGLPKQAGVTEARVDHPLRMMNSLPGVSANWGPNAAAGLASGPPGVLMLHRTFLIDDKSTAILRTAIANGWVVVHDMDDDPEHWETFRRTRHQAFSAVHAVTVSTEPLAAKLRQWNPHVRVFANAVPEFPDIAPRTPKSGGRLRFFFGALNREGDWRQIIEGIHRAAQELGDRAAFVVVHDKAFFDALPPAQQNIFLPTLPYEGYMNALRQCDVALLPLADTPFNRMKSDLKLVESLSVGAVPICSPTVYLDHPAHHDLAFFADDASGWKSAMLRLAGNLELIARMRERGRAYVRSHRLHAHQAEARVAYFRELLASREQLEHDRRARLRESAERLPATV